MKYFKKNPIFFVVMALLLLAFVGGVVYDVILMNQSSDSNKQLKKDIRMFDSALSSDPSQAQVVEAEANNIRLEKKLDMLVKDLTRESNTIFKPLRVKEGFQLVEELRGIVNKWRRDAQSKGIVVSDDMDFSFKKYVAPNSVAPASSAVAPIWRQVCVLDYVLHKLYSCKTEKSPMSIIAVQREILTEEKTSEEPNKKQRRTIRVRGRADMVGDNFEIDKNVTARVPGSIATLAYRFTFTGHTDILRRFLNELKDFDAMLVVRSIDVKPADATQGALGFGGAPSSIGNSVEAIFGAVADNSAENPNGNFEGAEESSEAREPVVKDNISQFTVVVEYVDVITDSAKTVKSEKK